MRIAIAGLLATLSLPSIALAQEPAPPPPDAPAMIFVPRFTVFAADVGGKVEADEASFPAPILNGSSLHFDSDLGIDSPAPVWIFEVAVFRREAARYFEKGSLSWLEASFEGSSTFGSTETFNGRTFAAGTNVDSKVHYRSWGADFSVADGDLMFENTSGAFMLGFRYTDLRVQLEGGGQETDERIRLFNFGGGVRGERRFGDHFSAVLSASFYFAFGGYNDPWDLEYEEWGAYIFEGLAGLTGTLGFLRLEAGWRYLSNSSYAYVDSSDKFEDNDFLLELSGPYLSVTLSF